jgi:hypothetical protein
MKREGHTEVKSSTRKKFSLLQHTRRKEKEGTKRGEVASWEEKLMKGYKE